MKQDGLVVIGGSYAGLNIAASAREAGYAEPIRLLAEEAELPYHRPPLSKVFLLGKVAEAALPLRNETFYRDNRIDFVPRTRLAAIDRTRRTVETADGRRWRFSRLALATGARPRMLPGAPADVLYLRSVEDARRLRERIGGTAAAVIVGGGYIGLEAAAVLATLGKQVTIVEIQDRLLARAAAPPFAEYAAALHRGRGVKIRLGTTVQHFGGGRVHYTDGTSDPADLVIVAVGVVPNSEAAEASGLSCRDGIVVDGFARTSDPDIFAAGDCTSHPSRFAGGMVRLESVQNATDQAKAAGANIAGKVTAYDAVPWFWSDQYETKFQTVGFWRGYDRVVTRGSIEDGRFSLFYFRGPTLLAMDSVNRPAEHVIGRRLVASGAALTPEQAADLSQKL
jgi:3-phenylpropionate/trans-cinnamate dioxygenase ferredoxin reductase component